ncbi:MAG: hypothetical protein HKN73_02945 [Gemmatimonadetes bacterium]|nr:hypothetical protein [Gemmatimonadota bacterium]
MSLRPISSRLGTGTRFGLRSGVGAAATFVLLQGPVLGPEQVSAQVTTDVRALLAEQARRIDRLEDLLNEVSEARIGPASVGQGCLAADFGVEGWRSADAWDRVSVGMSEAKVIATLGPPSRVRPGPAHRTLVYEEVSEQGDVRRGVVRITEEDQVDRIRPPN